MRQKKETEIFMRNFIFGVEDSLVSTVGLLSGIAAAGVPKFEIFLTGVVLVFVEAFSMGVGSFLSEETTEDQKTKSKVKKASQVGALIMVLSYFVAGLIPLVPYLLFSVQAAFVYSILGALCALFALGALSARIYKRSIVRLGMRMLLLGGAAIFVGILVGRFVDRLLLS